MLTGSLLPEVSLIASGTHDWLVQQPELHHPSPRTREKPEPGLIAFDDWWDAGFSVVGPTGEIIAAILAG